MAIRKVDPRRAGARREAEEAEDRDSFGPTQTHTTYGLFRQYITVRADGSLKLPASLRTMLALEPGERVEIELTTDGYLLVRPPGWGTFEAPPPDHEEPAGVTYDSTEEFLAALESRVPRK